MSTSVLASAFLSTELAEGEPHSAGTTGLASSGTSPGPRVHVIGAGAVGRAVLRSLSARGWPVVALSDSSATVYARGGLDTRALCAFKQRGGRLADWPGAEALPLELAHELVPCELVADASASDPAQGERAARVCRIALAAGKRIALARKDALAWAGAELLDAPGARVGLDAALGGTGAALARERAQLRSQCRSIALVANATSTLVLEALARGASLESGLAQARALGLLEGDARLDLDGSDALLKLAIASSIVFGRRIALESVARVDLAALDARALWRAAQRGLCTRLVARCTRAGELALGFESLARGDALAAPPGTVAYTYELADGSTRVHIGRALGAERTAAALVADLVVLASSGGAA